MRRKQIGLYIHIPFCKQKCSYCDFCSYAEKQDLISKYIKCLLQEIEEVGSNNRADFENGKDDLFSVKTIYIGGGTPSLIESKYIVQIMEEIKSNFELDENAEITIEVNPGTVTLEKLEDYNKVGINRLSIGLQSTHEHLLKEIGRIHTYLDFLDTYRFAREADFENINVDLMIGLPNQTLAEVKDSIEEIVSMDYPDSKIYLPTAVNGIYVINDIPSSSTAVPTPGNTYSFKIDTENNAFNVALATFILVLDPNDLDTISFTPASSNIALVDPPATIPVPALAGLIKTLAAPDSAIISCGTVLSSIKGTLTTFFVAD
jgi:coproporphyrinogen III oxidase-like Fe-S oxidoreductase